MSFLFIDNKSEVPQYQPTVKIDTLRPSLDEMGRDSAGFMRYTRYVIDRMGLREKAGLVKISSPPDFLPKYNDFDPLLPTTLNHVALQRIIPDKKTKGIYTLSEHDIGPMTVGDFKQLNAEM